MKKGQSKEMKVQQRKSRIDLVEKQILTFKLQVAARKFI